MNTAPAAGAAADRVDPDAVRTWLTGLQASIVAELERVDGHEFRADPWQRPEGGGGLTRVLEGGQVFERAGVLFSHVHGTRLPPAASARRSDLAEQPFEAMGVSLVLHPRNPYIPTVHMNVRFFAAGTSRDASAPSWWFGGGMDLTPYYPFEKDVVRFHNVCRQSLEAFGTDLYPRYKRWCDEYFFLKHRNEARGVGGIFFDDLNEGGFARCFALTRSVGEAFPDAYVPIVLRHRDETWGERERAFQAWRRGRYVEFNLIHDRGTLFGLQSGGRAESILCSMPPSAQWRYDWQPEPDSPEARLAGFLVARDWI